VNFEAYLESKKIDSQAFRLAEPEVWKSWSGDFEQMHPNSFTVHKLNLINPVRRKYPLKSITPPPVQDATATPAVSAASRPAKPVIKPKPKIG